HSKFHQVSPAISPLRRRHRGLLGRLFSLQLLNLASLALDFALLIVDLPLLLPRGDFLVLHRVADHVAGARAERTTDCRTRTRSAHRGADYRTSAGAENATAYRSFL